LLSDTDAKGQLTYRLYDIVSGKDLWTTTYAANSKVLQSEDSNFGGVVEPDGTVRVVDVRNGKEALKTKMDPKFLEKVTTVHLLSDSKFFFVACSGPTDPAMNPWGGVMTNLMAGTSMRALPVNGELYCFDAQTGKTKWHSPLLNQMIVLDHFSDIPVIIATSRYNRWMNVGAQRQVQQVVQMETIVKGSGKYVYKQENTQWQQFHAMNLDPKKGTIEMVNFNTKVTITATNDPLPEKKGTTDPTPMPGTTDPKPTPGGPRETRPSPLPPLPPVPKDKDK
jgi:outer membrane protein assembly factor BamB